jgi:hypothetical protein
MRGSPGADVGTRLCDRGLILGLPGPAVADTRVPPKARRRTCPFYRGLPPGCRAVRLRTVDGMPHGLPSRDRNSDRNEQHAAALGHHAANTRFPIWRDLISRLPASVNRRVFPLRRGRRPNLVGGRVPPSGTRDQIDDVSERLLGPLLDRRKKECLLRWMISPIAKQRRQDPTGDHLLHAPVRLPQELHRRRAGSCCGVAQQAHAR